MGKTQVDQNEDALGVRSVGDGADDATRETTAAHVRKALVAERVEALTRTVAELKATRSELQYDLSVSLDALAEERKRSAIALEEHRAAVAEERHLAVLAAERQRVAMAERDIESFRELAALRQQVACVERENEALREQVGRLSGLPSLLERQRTQLADRRERLSLVVHDRKSLRRELKRRGRLLARVRSDLRAAEQSVSALQRSVRGLDREKWVLQGEADANSALRRQNVELTHLVDQLCDGFHAVLASRRWRLGGAVFAVPRLLLLRRSASTAPDAMLRLVAEHRRHRTRSIGPPPAVNQGPSGGEDDGHRG